MQWKIYNFCFLLKSDVPVTITRLRDTRFTHENQLLSYVATTNHWNLKLKTQYNLYLH